MVLVVPIPVRNLRSFFEVDRYHVTIAALKSLADLGQFEAS